MPRTGAVGPGGALRALADRHPEHLWALADNLRQADPGERAAPAHLRDGQLAAAIAWYGHAGRVHPVTDRRRAVAAMVRSWAADTATGRDTFMLAYRRDHVEALNTVARALVDRAGLLAGPELTAPGGRSYRAGDRVISLAPGPKGAWVTSQPAQVTAVDPEAGCLTAVTPDGHTLKMGPDDIDADRLGYGYAVTAHRAQGATVDVAHVLADGGGRELAYVAMSRARAPATSTSPPATSPKPSNGWLGTGDRNAVRNGSPTRPVPPRPSSPSATNVTASSPPSPPTSPTASTGSERIRPTWSAI